ncbi:hypothetical protein [Anaerosacchariphilus polymeriproducens]|uniref:Uncharacterized protein n=1 Tax=Anaerosacchariphilus polymeriproducens TaxID=1812858 RepID=A0A371ARL0_9FIRM|nr:hypothetical protein [Anaerosacchariphilus polymeriproducens]RDU22182.1 hypothetical protein DWV06_16785 [Anaerosacchariphilus polymeriproducens]
MQQVKITFSNNETLVLEEGQRIAPISQLIHNSENITSQQPSYKIGYHISAGFIPSVTELICSCDFFRLLENENKIYKSSAVVSIENL